MQPRRCAFDDPTIDPQPTAVFSIAAGKSGTDAAPSQRLAVGLRIVSTIAEQHVGAFAGMSHFTAHVGDGVHDVEDFLNIGNIGTGDRHRQRNTLGVGDNVVLGPQLSAIRRVFARFSPPPKARA